MPRILYFETKYQEKWDDYVKESTCGTFFHLAGWKRMIEKTFRLEPVYLMAIDEHEAINGILPLFVMKDVMGKKYLVSTPFSTYAGVCADDEGTKDSLLDEAKKIAVERDVQYVEFRQLGKAAYDLPAKEDFITMFLKLEDNADTMWEKTINPKARNHIRKARKNGLTVDFGNEYLDEFYEVLSVNIRDLGSPNYPKAFLKGILDEFDDSSGIIVVKYQDKVIGGMLYICYKNMIFNPWAASLRKYNRLSPNDLLYWEAIKYACEKGYDHFDFGRSTINTGTFEFKKKMGGKPVQLHYQYFLHKMQKIPAVSAHNNKYQPLINIWKKLPMVVANVLGPRLIRYLPEL